MRRSFCFRAVSCATILGFALTACQKSDTGQPTIERIYYGQYPGGGVAGGGMGDSSSLTSLLNGLGGGGAGSAGLGGATSAGAANPLTPDDVARIQEMLDNLDSEGKQEVYDLVLPMLTNCSYIQNAGSAAANAAACQSGDPRGCAKLLVSYGVSYFRNLGGDMGSGFGNAQNSCMTINPSDLMGMKTKISLLKGACSAHSRAACLFLYLLVVRIFLFSFIAGLIH